MPEANAHHWLSARSSHDCGAWSGQPSRTALQHFTVTLPLLPLRLRLSVRSQANKHFSPHSVAGSVLNWTISRSRRASPLHRSVLAATPRSRATVAPKIDFRLEKLLLNQHRRRHSQSLQSSPGVKPIPASWTASPSTKMRTSTMPFARCRTRGRSPRSTSPCTPWRMARK